MAIHHIQIAFSWNARRLVTAALLTQHLKERSTIGVPHYEEVAPGVYVRQGQVAPRGGKPARITRDELRRQLGFDR